MNTFSWACLFEDEILVHWSKGWKRRNLLSPFVACSVCLVDFYFCKLKYTVFEEWFAIQKEVTQI